MKPIITLAALLLASPGAFAEDKPKAGSSLDAAALVGGYTIVSGERNGQKEPDERIKGTTVRFSDDAIIVTDKSKKDVYAATYKLEPGNGPCKITMTSKLPPGEGQVAKGLIEKDGKTIRLIYALPGGEAPTSFETKAQQMMFVLKNVNP